MIVHFRDMKCKSVYLLTTLYTNAKLSMIVTSAIAIYSICYSVLRPCAYWNSNAQTSIIDNGKQLSQKLNLDSFVTPDNLPNVTD